MQPHRASCIYPESGFPHRPQRMRGRIKQTGLQGLYYELHECLTPNQETAFGEVLVCMGNILCTDNLLHPGTQLEAARQLQTKLKTPSNRSSIPMSKGIMRTQFLLPITPLSISSTHTLHSAAHFFQNQNPNHQHEDRHFLHHHPPGFRHLLRRRPNSLHQANGRSSQDA